MSLYLEELVGAIAGAVVDAQQIVTQGNLGSLSRFFHDTKEGSLQTVKVKLPKIDPREGIIKYDDAEIPLITLVNHDQLSIQEMQVVMQIDINEMVKEASAKGSNLVRSDAKRYELKQPEKLVRLVTSETSTAKKQGDVGYAQITLKIKADTQPEALSRLLDHLNKNL